MDSVLVSFPDSKIMFITAFRVLFLIRLRRPKNKSLYQDTNLDLPVIKFRLYASAVTVNTC